jgi:hypothetical protein
MTARPAVADMPLIQLRSEHGEQHLLRQPDPSQAPVHLGCAHGQRRPFQEPAQDNELVSDAPGLRTPLARVSTRTCTMAVPLRASMVGAGLPQFRRRIRHGRRCPWSPPCFADGAGRLWLKNASILGSSERGSPSSKAAELGESSGQGRDRTADLAVFSRLRRIQIRPARFTSVAFALVSRGPGESVVQDGTSSCGLVQISWAERRRNRRYDLKLWIGSGDVSAAYLPG